MLTFGTGGLRVLGTLYYTRRLVGGLRILVKHTLVNENVSIKCLLWIRSVYTTAMTRKSKKSRMGKGKGKLLYYTGILRSGCFFVEVLGPTFYKIKNFLSQLHNKIPAPSQIVMQGFTNWAGFSKQVIYQFESIFGIDCVHISRFRKLHRIFVNQRRLQCYTRRTLRSAILFNVSPFGDNLRIYGYGRNLIMQYQKYLNNETSYQQKQLIGYTGFRLQCRVRNLQIFYLLKQGRHPVSYNYTYTPDQTIFYKKDRAAHELPVKRMLRTVQDFRLVLGARTPSESLDDAPLSSMDVFNSAYLLY